MKFCIGSVLVVSLIIIGLCIYKSYLKEHKLVLTVRRILQIGFLIVLFNLICLWAKSEKLCLFSYSIYFMAADWLLYYMLQFSLEYIGNVFEQHVKKKLMVLLLTLDSLFVISNNVFRHLFSLKPVTLFDGDICYALTVKPLFFIHFAVVLMLVVFCLISLFYKSIKAPYFYRKKYLTIALILTIIIIIHTFMLQSAIDISVVGYVVEGVLIYYCVFVYTPQRLLPQTLLMVAKDMTVGLFVMDIEGKNLYLNKYAEALLSPKQPLVDCNGSTLEEWCRHQYMNHTEEFTKEMHFYRDEEELIFKIQLQRMVDTKNQLQGGYFVIQDCTEEINNFKREQYLATHDDLTGLYNEHYFYEQAAKYIRMHPDTEFLMICTDIKDLKMINDFFGTTVGDLLLINIAKMLQEESLGAVIHGRLGNDVFSILMPKEKYQENYLVNQAQNIFSSSTDKGESFPVIVYIGVYEINDPTLPISVMCDRARMAIATIKGDYNRRVAHYNNVIRDNILYEQELISELDAAIAEGQLTMYLQPQASADGKVLGAEALVRWMHPEKGLIMPGDFISVFEKNGLISAVDQYIWETACKVLQKWKNEGKTDFYISVNISPRDFYFLNIYQIFLDLIQKYDISPHNLKLEITETAIVMDLGRQIELISKLRQNGFIVEMDDFGSGYSSLNMLKDIHVDILKIDMAFLKKSRDEERSHKILEMIINLSSQLDMPVITEGVETLQQVEELTKMGCNIFQGYFFAKPMSVDEFERLYMQ